MPVTETPMLNYRSETRFRLILLRSRHKHYYMPPQHSEPSLYGITPGNSNRFGENLWEKNRFNSTFPLALCLFIRVNHHLPICVVSRGGKIIAEDQVWMMSEVIGDASKELYFCFEETFRPYASLSRNEVDNIEQTVLEGFEFSYSQYP